MLKLKVRVPYKMGTAQEMKDLLTYPNGYLSCPDYIHVFVDNDGLLIIEMNSERNRNISMDVRLLEYEEHFEETTGG